MAFKQVYLHWITICLHIQQKDSGIKTWQYYCRPLPRASTSFLESEL